MFNVEGSLPLPKGDLSSFMKKIPQLNPFKTGAPFDCKALLIIDPQIGFINDHTAPILSLLDQMQHQYEVVAISRFINHSGSFFDRLDSHELKGRSQMLPRSNDTALAISLAPEVFVFDKSGYSAITPELMGYLSDSGVTSIDVCGIETDACVFLTAIDLFESNFPFRILSHLCASMSGPDAHHQALSQLELLVGRRQVCRDIFRVEASAYRSLTVEPFESV